MKEVTFFKTEDGNLYETEKAAICHEETISFNKENIVALTEVGYMKVKKYFFDLFEKEKHNELISLANVSRERRFKPAVQFKPFFDKPAEEHRADALAYGERWEKPSNPGIGSNR